MAQLDDRDQLARRVADLQKQEEKLVLRCTALEQDRQSLSSQIATANSVLSDGAAARSKLQQQLAAANADREEAVRLNLNLQVCGSLGWRGGAWGVGGGGGSPLRTLV